LLAPRKVEVTIMITVYLSAFDASRAANLLPVLV